MPCIEMAWAFYGRGMVHNTDILWAWSGAFMGVSWEQRGTFYGHRMGMEAMSAAYPV